MKKLILSFFSAVLFFTISAQVTENFSAYTTGGKIAQQAQGMGNDYWTTWSGAVGAAEDGVIAEVSGNKCLFLNEGNDQVLKLGDKTSGVWELSLKFNVPTGKDGYFNIKSVFPSTVSATWACQIYLGTDQGEDPLPGPITPGVGIIYGGSSTGTNFNFTHDTWIPVKIIIDLDDDNAEFYVNGNLIHTWIYSTGSFGASSHKFISACNMFPPFERGTSSFYLDDIVFAPASSSFFETNFDDVPNGSYVAQSYPDWWATWENKPGTGEDALITNEQSESAPQSAKLDDGTDLVFKAGNKTEGIYKIDFDMYIPDGAPAFFNLLHIYTGTSTGNEWGVGVYCNIPSGTSGMTAGTYIQTNNQRKAFTAKTNEWFPISFYIDLDNDFAKISIDGIPLLGWKFSTKESGGAGLKQLAAADFYPPTATSVFYIDNFVYKIAEAETIGIFDVTPTSISKEIVEGGSNITVPITVKNTGNAQGSYEAKAADVAWLTLSGDTESNVAIGETKSFDAVLNANTLEAGEYEAAISVVASNDVTFEIPCKLVIVLGIENFTIQTSIFPNPTSDVVNIICNTMINSIQLVNNNGQVVYSNNVNEDKTTIDTSNLSTGHYFIRIFTNNGISSTKLIIQ